MAGVQIKMRKHIGLNHQKSVVLYGKGMTIFGSSNWTGPSSNSQDGHNYFTTKKWFFDWFVSQFERKWNSSTENVPLFRSARKNRSTSCPRTTQRASRRRSRCAGKVAAGRTSTTSTSALRLIRRCSCRTRVRTKAAPCLVNRGSIQVPLTTASSKRSTCRSRFSRARLTSGASSARRWRTSARMDQRGVSRRRAPRPIRLLRLHQRLHRPQHPRQPQRRVLARVAE